MHNLLCDIFNSFTYLPLVARWLGVVKIRRSDEVEDPSVYSDTELCGFDDHKTVILHLLSQLKLGMDLTKVSSTPVLLVVCLFYYSDAFMCWCYDLEGCQACKNYHCMSLCGPFMILAI